jgi:HD-GYP domain-containing protein (c-di-GMP phosphodiesterase class II)
MRSSASSSRPSHRSRWNGTSARRSPDRAIAIGSLFTTDTDIIDNLDDIIESLTTAVHARDTYTRHHLEQAAALSDLFLGYLTVEESERRTIRIACMLHDIGKLGVPQDILQKSEFLTREEYEIVRKHPEIGARILEPLRPFSAAVPCIRHHHERWDGKGYPEGLRGPDIPFGARVVSLVDSFHAMVSKRPYQSRVKGLGYAREEIRRNAGTQFDPQLAATFVRMIEEQAERMAVFVESDSEATPQRPVCGIRGAPGGLASRLNRSRLGRRAVRGRGARRGVGPAAADDSPPRSAEQSARRLFARPPLPFRLQRDIA